ncbi:MAG: glycoside hydrolase family 38 C-terminal domain-containing protein [Candidatus Kapaibacterium sp.]
MSTPLRFVTPIHLIGNAHLDPAWMWRMDEGLESFSATCRSALDRMSETEDFIFTCSSAAHYAFVEETDPLLFKRIKRAVKLGKWKIVGGWWVEADCNLPSGESFARQALLGQRYFFSRFGVIAKTGYNIDSFGHNGNLPQLLRKSGIENYVFMRPEEAEKHLPSALFEWVAPSGDEVLAYRLPLHYSNYANTIREKLEMLSQYPLYDSSAPWMLFYGVGNHGGGPTKEQIKQIEEAKSSDHPEIRFSDPDTFFKSAKKTKQPQRYTGDINPHSIGCYSAHSEIKQLNRRSENALAQAEICSAMAAGLVAAKQNTAAFSQAWQNVCFNQFHDLLGGVAIAEALDDVITMYREALSIAEREQRVAWQRLASRMHTLGDGEALIVFNASGFEREEIVEFELWHPDASEKGDALNAITIEDAGGNALRSQRVESSGKIGNDRVRFIVKCLVPALGYAQLRIKRQAPVPIVSDELETLTVNEHELSNAHVGITFDGISSRGHTLTELFYAPAEVFDDPSDTWGHGLTGFTDSIGFFQIKKISVIEQGPLRARVRVVSVYGSSSLTEDFLLEADANCMHVRCHLNWQEQRKVVKLRYPHNLDLARAHYETPYAAIEHPIASDEHPGQSWVAASGYRSGVRAGLAVLTDSKSSYSVDAKYLNVTVARSPLIAHHAPPHVLSELQAMRYLDAGEQSFEIRLLPHLGELTHSEIAEESQKMLRPLIAHSESKHEGNLPIESSGITIDKSNILLSTMKQAEDGKGMIVRLFDASGVATNAKINCSLLSAKWSAKFKPYEVLTFRIMKGKVSKTNFIEC